MSMFTNEFFFKLYIFKRSPHLMWVLKFWPPKIGSCVLFNGASQAPQMNLFLKRLIFFSCLFETIIFYNSLLFLHEFSFLGCDFTLSLVSFTYFPKILVYSYFFIYLFHRSDRRYLYLYVKDLSLVHDTLLWFLVELWLYLFIYLFFLSFLGVWDKRASGMYILSSISIQSPLQCSLIEYNWGSFSICYANMWVLGGVFTFLGLSCEKRQISV